MAEIFGLNKSTYMGAFRTVAGTGISFNGKPGAVNLVQNFQTSHQQPVQNLFEVGSNNRYYVLGKASGTFTMSQILGFGAAVLDTIRDLSDPCTGNRTLTITFPNAYCKQIDANVVGNNAAKGDTLSITLRGVLLQSVGFSVAAENNLISSQNQGLMTNLEYNVTPAK